MLLPEPLGWRRRLRLTFASENGLCVLLEQAPAKAVPIAEILEICTAHQRGVLDWLIGCKMGDEAAVTAICKFKIDDKHSPGGRFPGEDLAAAATSIGVASKRLVFTGVSPRTSGADATPG